MRREHRSPTARYVIAGKDQTKEGKKSGAFVSHQILSKSVCNMNDHQGINIDPSVLIESVLL